MPTANLETPRHAVAIVGGATAGAEAASIFAEHGVLSAVFEQNLRPYGKIEDGLPRWHDKLRRKEYDAINSKLDHPLVHFVPSTRIGADIELADLAGGWGFSAVILANGAWRDRPFPVPGADEFLSRGLVYQNPFIFWFNHFLEKDYSGPQYDVPDGAIVVGGGLASIDVVKALQIEGVRRAMSRRGVEIDALEIEHAGIPAALAEHGLQWSDLGLRGARLYYRRRIEDMPLAEGPEEEDPARVAKVEATRRKILEKAMQKYCFETWPLYVPIAILSENGRLTGVRFQCTRVDNGRAVPIDGKTEDVATSLVISSIGSIPEPMRGVNQRGQLYEFSDLSSGKLEGYESVFGTGNVVTGKGNIKVSRKHSIEISTYVAESFLGLRDGNHGGEGALLGRVSSLARQRAEDVERWVAARPPLEPGVVEDLLGRIRSRQRQVGYDGQYREWIARVSPPDLA